MSYYGKDAMLMADTFDVFAQAFLVTVGPSVGPGVIPYKEWKKGYEAAMDLKKTIERARSASRLERLEIGAKIVTMAFPIYALDIFGDMVEVRQLASEGQRLLGAESFDSFKEAGLPSEEIEHTYKAGIVAADAQIENTQKAIERESDIVTKRYDKLIADYKEKSGFRARRNALTSIQEAYASERDAMYEAMQNGDIAIDAYYKLADAATAELKEKIEPYDERYHQDLAEIERLKDQCNREIARGVEHLTNHLLVQMDLRDQALGLLHGAVVKDITSNSDISEDAATTWAEEQEVTPAAQKRLKKMGYPVDQLRKDMAEFYRLSNGRLGKAAIVTKGHRRACAAVNAAVVYLDGRFTKSTLFHELGHLLEVHPRIKAAANQFLELRSGKAGTKTLRKLTGNKGYRGGERAYEDHFIHPYVGKRYDDGITEVTSMGFQCFANPKELSVLMEKDGEMMSLIMGIMKTPISDTEKQIVGQKEQAAKEERSLKSDSEQFYKELDEKAAKVLDVAKLQGFTIESYRGPRVKNPNRFYSITPNGQMLPVFTKEKYLKRFMYLFLTNISQVGWEAAWKDKYQLANDVVQDRVPTAIVGAHGEWQIDDLKDSVFTEVPR